MTSPNFSGGKPASGLHSGSEPDARPYTEEELRNLVEFTIDNGGNDIAGACLRVVHFVKASLRDLCRQAMQTRTETSLDAWRVFGPHGCMEVFLSVLNHPESRVRESAVKTLRYVGRQEALVALKRLSHDPSEMVRLFARRAVKALEGPTGKLTYNTGGPIDLSATRLKKPDPMERTIVALLLGREVPAVRIKHAASLLSHPNNTLRHAALKSLEEQKAGTDALYSELARGKQTLNDEIIQLLAKIKDDRARDFLLESVNHVDYAIRRQCFKALSSFNLTSAVDSLIDLICQTPEVYDEDLAILLKRTGPAGIERLLDLFRRDEKFQRRGGRLLALVVGEPAISSLINALASPFWAVRESAIKGLVVLDAPAAQSLIQKIPTMASVREQKVGLRALYGLTRFPNNVNVRETLRCVAEMSSNRETCVEALSLLQNVPSPEGYKLLLDLLRSEDLALTRAALAGCEQLMRRRVEPPTEILRTVAILAGESYGRIQARALRVLFHALRLCPESQIPAMLSLLDFLKGNDVALSERVKHLLHEAPDTALSAMESAIHAGASETGALAELREKLLAKQATTSKRESPSGKAKAVEPVVAMAMKVRLDSYSSGHAIPRPFSAATKMSVTAPRMVVPADRFVLGVWVHYCDVNHILRLAQDTASGKPIAAQTKLGVQVPDNSILNVVVDLPDFEMEEESDTIYWEGGEDPIGNCTFSVTVPSNSAIGTHLGRASLWLAGLRIAKLDSHWTLVLKALLCRT